jgi:radical SAM protein with 4Fe4S-binding SPASM domain
MSSFVVNTPLPQFGLWDDLERKGVPASFELELTARCNNACRHCYINLPPGDAAAKANELTLDEICSVADQAVELGAVWCLITGGEPLLRADFPDIYMALKRRGLLLSVFTNAALVRPYHVDLFRAYPPRDLEVTMYGATRDTYERVTRVPGSFEAFERGVALLEEGAVPVRFKAMVLASNVDELPAMAEFGRTHTKDVFRFDPLLHLRYDRDPGRNAEIRAERLSPEQITAIERTDVQREHALRRECRRGAALGAPDDPELLFHCDIGQSLTIGHDGSLRLCAGLWHADYVGDVRKESLAAAWRRLMLAARALRSCDPTYLDTCSACPLIDLCLWCPAHADLETGSLDAFVRSFCDTAHARAEVVGGLGEEADCGAPEHNA